MLPRSSIYSERIMKVFARILADSYDMSRAGRALRIRRKVPPMSAASRGYDEVVNE